MCKPRWEGRGGRGSLNWSNVMNSIYSGKDSPRSDVNNKPFVWQFSSKNWILNILEAKYSINYFFSSDWDAGEHPEHLLWRWAYVWFGGARRDRGWAATYFLASFPATLINYLEIKSGEKNYLRFYNLARYYPFYPLSNEPDWSAWPPFFEISLLNRTAFFGMLLVGPSISPYHFHEEESAALLLFLFLSILLPRNGNWYHDIQKWALFLSLEKRDP